MITLGGDAELELVDSLDPFSEGIVFSVRPPKKSWKNIANLSGGEKTLSSLALVFALHHFKVRCVGLSSCRLQGKEKACYDHHVCRERKLNTVQLKVSGKSGFILSHIK